MSKKDLKKYSKIRTRIHKPTRTHKDLTKYDRNKFKNKLDKIVCPACKGNISVYACETCYNHRYVYD